MKKKYINLTGTAMNLQITRYSTIFVSKKFGLYDEKIANSFPAIFKLVETPEIIKNETKDIVEPEPVIEEDIVEPEPVIEEDIEVKAVNYARLTHQELKNLVEEKNLEIDGRRTSRKMIEALELEDF